MLSVQDVVVKFGGLTALDSVSIDIKENIITGLIGPNGAGKTTFFNCITGVYSPNQGHATIKDSRKNIISLFEIPHYKRVRLGLVRTFQNIRLFSKMSVIENVLMGTHIHKKYSFVDALLHSKNEKQKEKEALEYSHTILKDLALDDLSNTIADSLPYGKQKRLEIARALATRPRLLLLDEPAAGMNSQETKKLMETIETIMKKYSVTVFLIEHDMHFVMNLCDTIYVLDYGRCIAQGTAQEVSHSKKVIEAYLGT